jgi:hypothetical protein
LPLVKGAAEKTHLFLLEQLGGESAILHRTLREAEKIGEREKGRTRERNFKRLTHMTVELPISKPSGQALRLKSQRRADVAVLSQKAVWRQNTFFFWGPQPFSQHQAYG